MKTIGSLLLLLSAPLAASAADGATSAKPNILLIVADDLGYGDIGVHGGKAAPTPHIDKLAAKGIRCTHGYVSAPYCSPSRAGLLTGRYQTRFGHEFNPHVGAEGKLGLPLDQRTMADLLRSAGYATGLVGKWHLGFSKDHHPQARGFDDFFGFLVGGHNYALRKDAEPKFASAMAQNVIHRGRELQKPDGFATDVFTDEAIGFMKRNRDRPWFLYLAFNAVHTPLEISDKLKDRVPADVTDPARRGYLALLLGLDDAIGRIMAHLGESGADRNTLIIFISDNGGSGMAPFLAYNTGINRPLRGNKGQTLEGGIRVPFFIAWPGKLPAGKTYDHPVIALDILPTACAAAGVTTPKNVDGVNLLPHLAGENHTAPHEALYWRFGPQKAIRKGNLALVDWRDFERKTNSGWQLFDLSKDIGQQNDLAAKQPELVAELSQAWGRWDAQNLAPLWHGGVTEDPTAPPPVPRKESKILFIGKNPDHPYGSHMYMHASGMLAKCAELTPGIQTVVSNGWPKEPKSLEGVKSIVVYTSPGAEFLLEGPHRHQVDELMKKGVGLVTIHWASAVYQKNFDQLGPTWLSYLGGTWVSNVGLSGGKSPLKQLIPGHPICRGWKEYEIEDEYYLDPVIKQAKPLLRVKERKDKDVIVGWVYERPDGGRAFGTTLGHPYKNFEIEAFRRMIVNGILWSAHVEVPQAGAPVNISAEALALPPKEK